MELRKFEEKSEQQANIINSGQVDLWLQELHQEMSTLQEDLEQRRTQVSQQAASLNELEKKKIDRVIINKVEVLERELRIAKKQIQDNLLIGSRLRDYNSKLRESLVKEQESYSLLTSEEFLRIDEMIDLDFNANQEKYWKLLDKREALELQISSLNETIER